MSENIINEWLNDENFYSSPHSKLINDLIKRHDEIIWSKLKILGVETIEELNHKNLIREIEERTGIQYWWFIKGENKHLLAKFFPPEIEIDGPTRSAKIKYT